MSVILNVINYFWKLGFNEVAPELFRKEFSSGYYIDIALWSQEFRYGERLRALHPALLHFGQRNFVVLELVDRLLRQGYLPEHLELDGRAESFDLLVRQSNGTPFLSLRCEIWEDDFDTAAATLGGKGGTGPRVAPLHGLYTSRLKAGLIDRRYVVFLSDQPSSLRWESGLLEEEVEPFCPQLAAGGDSAPRERLFEITPEGFEIRDQVLVRHHGHGDVVQVPIGVRKLANAVFWNRKGLRKVVLPDTLLGLGGDTFFDCTDLEEVEIPESVRSIGDNPFADCPRLHLGNRSPWFRFENGLLFDKANTRVIYSAILGEEHRVVLPEGLISVGKHAFHKCQRLKEIVLPASLRIIENNPFSDCAELVLHNRSSHFVLREGALYDAGLNTLFSYEPGRDADTLEIPEGVRIIGRHSFYNCQRLRSVVLARSVKTIGYNPFARCSSLRLENRSPSFILEDDALYDEGRRELIYCSIARPGDTFVVPAGVRKIGRSAFFACKNLREVVLPEGLTTIERSAFADCTNLERLNLPDTVSSLGEWAFRNCASLREIVVPPHVTSEPQTFLGSSVVIGMGRE